MAGTVHLPISVDWESDAAQRQVDSLINALNDLTRSLGGVTTDLGNTDDAAGKMGESMKRSSMGAEILTGALRKIGEMLVNAAVEAIKFGAQMALSLGQEAVAAASNLEEQTNKFNVVFRGMTEEAGLWRDELVESYMMSSVEATTLMASMQDLLKPMGMAAESAGQMGSDVIKLAADMGSFNDLPTADVLADIRSALVGQSEPMLKYSSDTRAAAVEQKALEMGIGGVGRELTMAEKAMAIYQIILESNTDAIGDSARSFDSYANTAKRVDAVWVEMTATLGKELLPVLSKFMGWAIDMGKEAMPMIAEASAWLATQMSAIFDAVIDLADIALPYLSAGFSIISEYIGGTVIPALTAIIDFFIKNDWGIIFGTLTIAIVDMAWNTAVSILDISWRLFDQIKLSVYEFLDDFYSLAGSEDSMFVTFAKAALDAYYRGVYNTFAMIKNGFIATINWILEKFVGAINTMIALLPDWAQETLGLTQIQLKNWQIEHAATMDDMTEDEQKALDYLTDMYTEYWKIKNAQAAEGGEQQVQTAQETNNSLNQTAQETVNSLSLPGTGASGADAAAGYTEGWNEVWDTGIKPSYEQQFDDFVGAAEDAAEDVAAAAAAAQQAWSDLTIPGSQTTSGYQWNGHTYVYSPDHNEWGYEDWRAGLPYWQAASQEFYDAFGLSHALTGGLIDMMRGVIPSFARGGEVPIIAHAGEVVIPTQESGHTYKGLSVGQDGQVQGGGVTIHVHCLTGYDGVYQAAKEIWPMLQDMHRRKEIKAMK